MTTRSSSTGSERSATRTSASAASKRNWRSWTPKPTIPVRAHRTTRPDRPHRLRAPPPSRPCFRPTATTTAAASAAPRTDVHDEPPRLASAATDAAAALLCRLVELGVRHIVLSPGSRSQALALAAAELERRGSVKLHVRIDERVAGFTALGIGRETRMPAAVVCTSGTAAAYLLPASLEAHHAGVPLLLLTADRPPELRGVGANQTTSQPGMFAPSVRYETDLPVPEATDAAGDGEQSLMLRQVADEAFAAAM